MQSWQTTFLGMRELPRDISDFEMKAFFTFDGAEREAINARRGDAHKLGLALHIGFLRMSGRLLGAFRVVPVTLWRHLGNELGVDAPEVASLRAMYARGRTLLDHQQVACTVLGFRWMSEHQRRSRLRELREEVARCADRDQLLVRARQWLYKNQLLIVHERANYREAYGMYAKQKLGWVPEITLDQMITEMAATDLAEAKKHALLKHHGYNVSVSVE